jgi:hypothetical protein
MWTTGKKAADRGSDRGHPFAQKARPRMIPTDPILLGVVIVVATLAVAYRNGR